VPRASGGDGAHDAGPEGMRIGAQLKAARLAARMSMAEVAEQAGLTKGFVSKLERDLVNVSVASLIRLCDALGVSVGSLFQASRGEVVRRGAYPPINFGGQKISEYLLTPSSEKRMQAILSDLQPGGGSGDEPYALPADVEFVFVLAGELEMTLAEGPTQVLWVFSPALPDTAGPPAEGERYGITAAPSGAPDARTGAPGAPPGTG